MYKIQKNNRYQSSSILLLSFLLLSALTVTQYFFYHYHHQSSNQQDTITIAMNKKFNKIAAASTNSNTPLTSQVKSSDLNNFLFDIPEIYDDINNEPPQKNNLVIH